MPPIHCSMVIGARVGTIAAQSMEHVSAFVGRYVPDFYQSCMYDVFPAGTLAIRDDKYYEVQWVDQHYRLEAVRIQPPEPGEIVTREGER